MLSRLKACVIRVKSVKHLWLEVFSTAKENAEPPSKTATVIKIFFRREAEFVNRRFGGGLYPQSRRDARRAEFPIVSGLNALPVHIICPSPRRTFCRICVTDRNSSSISSVKVSIAVLSRLLSSSSALIAAIFSAPIFPLLPLRS